MLRAHHVIFIPGLNDGKRAYELFVSWWRIYGVVPHVHRIMWNDAEQHFGPKLQILIEKIQDFTSHGDLVSLVGGSAGGSAALNALCEEPRISAVVNLCGRLKAGVGVFPSLDEAAKHSPSFRDSVLMFEKKEPQLTPQQRMRVLTLSPIWDELVPRSTVHLGGAVNVVLPSIEHILTGILGVTLFSPMIVDFLKRTANQTP